MSFYLSEYNKIDVGWGFAPDPTEAAYSVPTAGFKGAFHGRKGMEGRGGLGEGRREGTGKMGNREGRGKREVGGIAPWLLGDRRVCWGVPLGLD